MRALHEIFEGWEGYNTSLTRAIGPRTPTELAFKPVAGMRSLGEIAAHVALGRVDWFARMGAPAVERLDPELLEKGKPWSDLAKDEPALLDAGKLVDWLDASWRMIDRTLHDWSVDDIFETFRQPYGGKVFAVSRQWVLWRIMCHDIQHGGQISVFLRMQDIDAPDLIDFGGHLTEPPLVDD